ncbi:MAG: hypothetical protein KBD16_01215 [Candidatus Pacebacteria bacterium]|nr:hypothetical protein [Candidatus Paceibacterota bacterium]
MKTTLRTAALLLSFAPAVVLAAPAKNLGELIKMFTSLVNPLIGLLTGLALLFFIWGIVQYILYAGDEKKKKSGKDTMVYGVIALFVLFSFWGIVRFLSESIFGK